METSMLIPLGNYAWVTPACSGKLLLLVPAALCPTITPHVQRGLNTRLFGGRRDVSHACSDRPCLAHHQIGIAPGLIPPPN